MDFIKGNEQVKIDPNGIDISGTGHIIIDSNSVTGDISFNNKVSISDDFDVNGELNMVGDLSMNGDIEVYNGKVGIGKTATSGILLDVSGNINFNGDLYKNGSLLSLDGNQATAVISRGMAVQIKHTDYNKKIVKVDAGWSWIDKRTDGNGFVVKITPRSVNSKILIDAIAHVGISPANDTRWWGIRLYRKIGNGDWDLVTGAQGDVSVAHAIKNSDQTQASTTYTHQGQGVWFSHNVGMLTTTEIYNDNMLISNSSGSYLDSPNTTEEVMYTLYWNSKIGEINNSSPIYLNRTHRHDDYFRPTASSSITATEIWDDSIPFNPSSLAIQIDENTNNVGIGTSNPLCSLYNYQDKSSGWAAQSYFGNSTEGFIAGTFNNIACIGGHNSSLNAWTDIALAPEGNVGIGTFNPGYPLHVHSNNILEHFTWLGFGWATDWKDGANQWNQRTSNPYGAGYTGDINEPISIWCETGLRANKIFINSDKRIKTDISLISDDTALNQVNTLESYEYHYIDPERRRPMKTIGFIAQEVKAAIPNAVSLEKNYVPDEMRIIAEPAWTEDAGKYYLNIPDLDMSGAFTGKAKFYVSNDLSGNDEECKEVDIKEVPTSSMNEFSTTNYVAEFDQSWNNVFFYGKEVNDFHTIDKAQIFALHHSAIQELDRKHKREVTEKNNKIQTLEGQVTNLTGQVSSLTSRLEALEASVLSLQNN